ncbi:hypothetical protein [Acidovorax sp. Root217]|uniref:hypothetical protein n=1 Tax=Acidovorax sp. Root217 TaxID=1736492 RepID=UPI00070A94C4|nr:hypothetical protein [Acidovorax sp. Root217]KRC24828.1 hypothetical protein ASE31_20395 [Acidovorax sp. Root217]
MSQGGLKPGESDGKSASLESAGMWKAWVVLCISESQRMGLTPVSTAQLHVILYLANTLADLYGVTRVRGRVLKRGAYPFFPDVQREVDRLAFAGVLTIEHVEFGVKGHLAAHYALGERGAQISQAIVAHSMEAQRTAQLLCELVCACFGRFLYERADIGAIDANYGDALVLDGEVVDFSEWSSDNKNMGLARLLIEKLRALRPDAQRDGVRLYCDYLDKALAPA